MRKAKQSSTHPEMPRLSVEQVVDQRELRQEVSSTDLVVAGGGISGVCAAVAAAREGCKVVLIQDRPVLGGNASSEVRLWMLGATSHMGNNNRWSREGGVVGDILVENMYRNPEGNPLILDALLLEMVEGCGGITLLLNTCVTAVKKSDATRIESVEAFCSQNSTRYSVQGKMFMDCTGDGILAFLAGAAFRMGAEMADEFGEKMAPSDAFGNLLGHSLYFYSKDTGKAVDFIKPAFCDVDIAAIYRYRSFKVSDQGCNFWWVEYGGRCDTVHDTETIKWELWKIVYGIWDYIKNSGKFPEARTHTLEWVGTIPGKRESRRFEGYKILTQRDIVERRVHPDAIAYGGWALDLHPADGVYSKEKPCLQRHAKAVYQIPLGATLSRSSGNLAFGGRIISTTHVAFGSSRVMATCGNVAQGTAVALAYALRQGLSFASILEQEHIDRIQKRLLRMGHHIPGVPLHDDEDLSAAAELRASSEYRLCQLVQDGPGRPLDVSCAMLIPTGAGSIPLLTVPVEVNSATELRVELRRSGRAGEFTPDVTLEVVCVAVCPGDSRVTILFESVLSEDGYHFICFLKNEAIRLGDSSQRMTGVLSLFNGINKAVSNHGRQEGGEDLGIESFEFWCPGRRPGGRNLALNFDKPVFKFGVESLRSGYARPTDLPNAWIADPEDPEPSVTLRWDCEQSIQSVVVMLDTDYDHAMESVLMGHPEREMPFCVRELSLWDGEGVCVGQVTNNHHSRVVFKMDSPLRTRILVLRVEHPSRSVPASLFSIRCYQRQLC